MNREFKKFTPKEIEDAVEEFRTQDEPLEEPSQKSPSKIEPQIGDEEIIHLPDDNKRTLVLKEINPWGKRYVNPEDEAMEDFIKNETKKVHIDSKISESARENYLKQMSELKSYIEVIKPGNITTDQEEGCKEVAFYYGKDVSYDSGWWYLDESEAERSLKLPQGIFFRYYKNGYAVDTTLTPSMLDSSLYIRYREKQDQLNSGQTRQLGEDRLYKLLRNLEIQMQNIHNEAAVAIQQVLQGPRAEGDGTPLRVSIEDARQLFKALFFIAEHSKSIDFLYDDRLLHIDQDALIKEVKERTGADIAISSRVTHWHDTGHYIAKGSYLHQLEPYIESLVTFLQPVSEEKLEQVKELINQELDKVET